MTWAWIRPISVAVLGAAAMTDCSSTPTTGSPIPASTADGAAGHHRFYFRPVLCEIPAFSSAVTTPSVTSAGPPNPCTAPYAAAVPSTPDYPTAEVILAPDPEAFATSGFRYVLGPPDMDGSVIAGVQTVVDQVTGQHSIQLSLTAKGATEFDHLAQDRFRCYQQNSANPPPCSLEAFNLDGLVESAPTFQASSFNGNVLITGNFTASEAGALAKELKLASINS